jgi:biotin synthase
MFKNILNTNYPVIASEATQALCFLAGANSIFTGDKLLTAANAGDDKDTALMAKLGLVPMEAEEPMRVCKPFEEAA